MKKIYKSPTTDVIKINLRFCISMSASEVGDSTTNPGGSYGGEVYGEEDLSRDNDGNNHSNVWDNAW